MQRKFLKGQQNWKDCTENDFFDIPNHEDYEINIFGDVFRKARISVYTRNRVREIPRRKMAVCILGARGYKTVSLNGKRYCLHKVLADTFLENPNKYDVVDHIDGNKLNNSIDNLEWCSHSENTQRAYDNGLCNRNKKVMCVELGLIFNSEIQAAKWTGNINRQSRIGRAARGERKTVCGYHWEFV